MNNTMENLRQNLMDAKCPRSMTEECVELAAEGKSVQMMTRLRQQRKELLDEIHKHQKALDCLDYLMFQLENQNMNRRCI